MEDYKPFRNTLDAYKLCDYASRDTSLVAVTSENAIGLIPVINYPFPFLRVCRSFAKSPVFS